MNLTETCSRLPIDKRRLLVLCKLHQIAVYCTEEEAALLVLEGIINPRVTQLVPVKKTEVHIEVDDFSVGGRDHYELVIKLDK